MGLISLEGMEFFAYHGHFDEEQRIGNKYSIDVSLEADLHYAASSDRLQDTIDYGSVYRIVQLVMQKKHRLLEHVGHEIIAGIQHKFSAARKITVSVSKFNPPIGGVCERARIVLSSED